MTARRTAILISGRGSNMRALIEAAHSGNYPARICLVLSNNPDAEGLVFARDAGIACAVLPHRQFARRADFDAAMHAILQEHQIELVCLAGFMRLLTEGFVEAWCDRLINIHPSLLPDFPGLDTHARALEAGHRVTGCTVHFVRPAMDQGPIILQAKVPVRPGDTVERLAARVLAAEHIAYPLALRLVASGQAKVVVESVQIDAPDRADGFLNRPVIVTIPLPDTGR